MEQIKEWAVVVFFGVLFGAMFAFGLLGITLGQFLAQFI